MAKISQFGIDKHKLTEQQVLNIAIDHILDQGKPSVGEGGNLCRYDNGAGCHCLAAPFLPEKHKGREGESWHGMTMHIVGFPREHRKLISRLQTIHDQCYLRLSQEGKSDPDKPQVGTAEFDKAFTRHCATRLSFLANSLELETPPRLVKYLNTAKGDKKIKSVSGAGEKGDNTWQAIKRSGFESTMHLLLVSLQTNGVHLDENQKAHLNENLESTLTGDLGVTITNDKEGE